MRSRFFILLWLILSAAVALAQDAETNPAVPLAGNPHGPMELDCKLCHAGSSWEVSHTSEFNHETTGFELEGLHRFALCRDCHREPVFAHIGTQCADCHNDTHRGRLGPACADCHTPNAWIDQPRMRQDHNATALPLVGAHERVDCEACHDGAATSDYIGTPSDCYACHADTYAATTAPDHQVSSFGIDCERCHGVFSATWGSGDFIHDQSFPLNGSHRMIECADCHSDGFGGTTAECIGCHQDDYDGTDNPSHIAANFPTECMLCHNESSWLPGLYDHDATAFPLTGAHKGPDCLVCHSTGYVGLPTECAGCHQEDYDGTTTPDHQVSSFPLDCRTCHNDRAWEPADYDHDNTAFPLTGAHLPLDCLTCHSTGYTGLPVDCAGCHQDDYDNTTTPDHQVSNFPLDCRTCHNDRAWEPADYDHDNTAFPLTGAHVPLDCVTCHSAGYTGLPVDCAGCHQDDYDNTTTPDHQVSSFSFF